MKKKFEIEAPGGATKVLLHTCCAPCSSAIIECLMQHGITPTIFYCNPNIYPLEEYLIRKNEWEMLPICSGFFADFDNLILYTPVWRNR